MGQCTQRWCHTQEIAYEPGLNEWRPMGHAEAWTQDHPDGACEEVPAPCRVCCSPVDSHIQEVLVVHHEALHKVDFLLRADEIMNPDVDVDPAVPQCVTEMRREKRRRLIRTQANAARSGGCERADGGSLPRRWGAPMGRTATTCQVEQAGTFSCFLQRIQMGMPMRLLDGESEHRSVTMSILLEEPPHLVVEGLGIQLRLPFDSIADLKVSSRCVAGQAAVSSQPAPADAPEFTWQDECVVVTLAETVGGSSHVLAFESSEDARDFRSRVGDFRNRVGGIRDAPAGAASLMKDRIPGERAELPWNTGFGGGPRIVA